MVSSIVLTLLTLLGHAAACEDDFAGLKTALLASTYSAYAGFLTSCAQVKTNGFQINLCTKDDTTRAIAQCFCPVTCETCPVIPNVYCPALSPSPSKSTAPSPSTFSSTPSSSVAISSAPSPYSFAPSPISNPACSTVKTACETLILNKKTLAENDQTAMLGEILTADGPCPWLQKIFAECTLSEVCCCCDCTVQSYMQELGSFLTPYESLIVSAGLSFDCKNDIMQCRTGKCGPSNQCSDTPTTCLSAPAPATTGPATTAPAPAPALSPDNDKASWRIKLNGTWSGDSHCVSILNLKGVLNSQLAGQDSDLPLSPDAFTYTCYEYANQFQLV